MIWYFVYFTMVTVIKLHNIWCIKTSKMNNNLNMCTSIFVSDFEPCNFRMNKIHLFDILILIYTSINGQIRFEADFIY